jgi:hypothetical protein
LVKTVKEEETAVIVVVEAGFRIQLIPAGEVPQAVGLVVEAAVVVVSTSGEEVSVVVVPEEIIRDYTFNCN